MLSLYFSIYKLLIHAKHCLSFIYSEISRVFILHSKVEEGRMKENGGGGELKYDIVDIL
jgi:hypothetical protein